MDSYTKTIYPTKCNTRRKIISALPCVGRKLIYSRFGPGDYGLNESAIIWKKSAAVRAFVYSASLSFAFACSSAASCSERNAVKNNCMDFRQMLKSFDMGCRQSWPGQSAIPATAAAPLHAENRSNHRRPYRVYQCHMEMASWRWAAIHHCIVS